MSAGTSVTVFPTIAKKQGRPKPYLVRWKVAGREKVRAHATKDAAQRFQTELRAAANAGRPFDTETCLPTVEATSGGGPTCLTLAREVLLADFADLSGRSNQSIAEGLAATLPALVAPAHYARVPDRQVLEPALMAYLHPSAQTANLPAAQRRALAWLERQSLPVGKVGELEIQAALRRAAAQRNGTPAARSTFMRKRAALSKLFTVALSRDLIAASPLRRARKTLKTSQDLTKPIDRAEVASAAQVLDLLGRVTSDPLRLQLSLMFYAGLRPGEADGLRVMDAYLVEGGRDELLIRRTTTEGRATWSATGQSREVRAPKHTREGTVRRVPISPALAAMLADAIAGKAADELVVQTRAGTPISSTNRARGFHAAREAWAAAQETRPSDLTLHVPYSLRHSAATLWLQGMPPAEVGARLGHSTAVLLRTYANVMPSESEHYNEQMDRLMRP